MWLRVAPCGSTCGSVWLYMWLCVALCGSVWLRVALCGSVWLLVAPCGSTCGSVWLCVALHVAPCGSVWLCVAPCGSVWLCVAPCAHGSYRDCWTQTKHHSDPKEQTRDKKLLTITQFSAIRCHLNLRMWGQSGGILTSFRGGGASSTDPPGPVSERCD
uniref:Uncharacterized protein n=1 Tax=Knipowitschia caucasica TaxID=637954 RepID=A0AAV2L5A8_KNICA